MNEKRKYVDMVGITSDGILKSVHASVTNR